MDFMTETYMAKVLAKKAMERKYGENAKKIGNKELDRLTKEMEEKLRENIPAFYYNCKFDKIIYDLLVKKIIGNMIFRSGLCEKIETFNYEYVENGAHVIDIKNFYVFQKTTKPINFLSGYEHPGFKPIKDHPFPVNVYHTKNDLSDHNYNLISKDQTIVNIKRSMYITDDTKKCGINVANVYFTMDENDAKHFDTLLNDIKTEFLKVITHMPKDDFFGEKEKVVLFDKDKIECVVKIQRIKDLKNYDENNSKMAKIDIDKYFINNLKENETLYIMTVSLEEK